MQWQENPFGKPSVELDYTHAMDNPEHLQTMSSLIRWRIQRCIGSLSIAQRIRQNYILSILAMNQPAGKRILDAGCGNGSYAFRAASRFPDSHIVGIDIDAERIDIAHKLHRLLKVTNTVFVSQDLNEQLPIDYFDIAYCVDVLEHIPDDLATLRNLFSTLRPDGTLIVHVPLQTQQRFLPWLTLWCQEDHVRDGYVLEEIKNKLDRAGFDIVNVRYTFGLFGNIGWEIEETCRMILKASRFLVLPLLLLASRLEILIPNKKGNAVCIVARKSKANI